MFSTVVAVLAAAGFSAPVTLAEQGSLPAAADGVAAWAQPDGVHLLGTGAISDGAATSLRVTRGVAGWAEPDGPHFWAGGADAVPAGALQQTRGIAVTPNLGAWVGVAEDGSKRVQIAPGFGAAQTIPTLGTNNYGLVAAGDAAGRSLLVWHSRSGDRWRIHFTTVAADGHVTGSGWLTPPGEDNTNPALAMAPDGSGVVAWTHGLTAVQARAIEPSGALGPVQDVGAGAGAVATAGLVAWRDPSGAVAAARRSGKSFGAAERIGGAGVDSIAASSTAEGDAIVAWTEPGATRASAAFGPPVTLGSGGGTVAAGGDRVVWEEADHRIRTATLVKTATPPVADRTAPVVRLEVLGLRKRILRVRVTSDENATARLTVRKARTPLTALQAGKPKVLRLKVARGRKTLRLHLRATDAAGNVRIVKRSLRR